MSRPEIFILVLMQLIWQHLNLLHHALKCVCSNQLLSSFNIFLLNSHVGSLYEDDTDLSSGRTFYNSLYFFKTIRLTRLFQNALHLTIKEKALNYRLDSNLNKLKCYYYYYFRQLSWRFYVIRTVHYRSSD